MVYARGFLVTCNEKIVFFGAAVLKKYDVIHGTKSIHKNNEYDIVL